VTNTGDQNLEHQSLSLCNLIQAQHLIEILIDMFEFISGWELIANNTLCISDPLLT
jgi:hypothetical protein